MMGAVCPSKESVLQPVGIGETFVNTHAPEGKSFHGSPGTHLVGGYERGGAHGGTVPLMGILSVLLSAVFAVPGTMSGA